MDALRSFILSFGLSLSDIDVAAETLYAENRKRIDASTPRRAFVSDPVRLDIKDYPAGLHEISLPNHPDRPDMGQRTVAAGPSFYLARADVLAHLGTEIRLKDLLNVRLTDSAPSEDGALRAQFVDRENRRIPRLQWVGAQNAVPVDLLGVDGSHLTGLAEQSLAAARARDIFQFERVGFVRVDSGTKETDGPVRVVFGHP